jgi:uracil-DNA glycosylase
MRYSQEAPYAPVTLPISYTEATLQNNIDLTYSMLKALIGEENQSWKDALVNMSGIYNRERFEEIARASMPWLEREVAVAKPKLIITLGAEVAGILRNVAGTKARNALFTGIPADMEIGSQTAAIIHLAHPGIVMRKSTGGRNPWPKRHIEEHIPALRTWLLENQLSVWYSP